MVVYFYSENTRMLASESTEIFILANACSELSERAGIYNTRISSIYVYFELLKLSMIKF